MDTLRSIASDVADIVRSGGRRAETSATGCESSVPELRITVDKEKAIDKGLTVGQVIQFVATKLAGKNEITQATLDGKNLSIYIIDGTERRHHARRISRISKWKRRSGDKTEMVRIGDIAEIVEEAPELYQHLAAEKQQRVVTVSFTVGRGLQRRTTSATRWKRSSPITPCRTATQWRLLAKTRRSRAL